MKLPLVAAWSLEKVLSLAGKDRDKLAAWMCIAGGTLLRHSSTFFTESSWKSEVVKQPPSFKVILTLCGRRSVTALSLISNLVIFAFSKALWRRNCAVGIVPWLSILSIDLTCGKRESVHLSLLCFLNTTLAEMIVVYFTGSWMNKSPDSNCLSSKSFVRRASGISLVFPERSSGSLWQALLNLDAEANARSQFWSPQSSLESKEKGTILWVAGFDGLTVSFRLLTW